PRSNSFSGTSSVTSSSVPRLGHALITDKRLPAIGQFTPDFVEWMTEVGCDQTLAGPHPREDRKAGCVWVSEVHPHCLGHLPLGLAARSLVVDHEILAFPASQGFVVKRIGITRQHDLTLALLDGGK